MGGGSSLQLVRVFGIRIGVNASWFLVLFLFIFLLSDAFRDTLGGDGTGAYFAAVAAALLFFGSIVLHELGHALMARRVGISVTGIDLFFFGGVMKMDRDTTRPLDEFLVAAAGPLVTFGLVLIGTALGLVVAGSWDGFWDAAVLSGDASANVGDLLIAFLVTLNAGLLIFNLVPAFPLDGGRIARALAWKITGSRVKATRFAALIGRGFAFALMGIGLVLALRGSLLDGLWLLALGWLLGQAARAAVVQTAFTERLRGVTVADIMDAEPVTVPADLPAERVYEDYFLRYRGWDWFAVVEADGRLLGPAYRAAVEQAATIEGGGILARSLVAVETSDGSVAQDAPLEALLGSEPLRRLGALMAVDADGRLRGVVTVDQVARAVQAHLAPG